MSSLQLFEDEDVECVEDLITQRDEFGCGMFVAIAAAGAFAVLYGFCKWIHAGKLFSDFLNWIR